MTLERERDERPTPCTVTEKKRAQLMYLNGIGPAVSAVMTREVYYRQFDNRRQVAAFLGLAPSPYDSGEVERSQGISRTGRGQVRGTMIQAAWLWIKHQPRSTLTRWFLERTMGQGGRVKRIMIVAVARKLRLRCGAFSNMASFRRARFWAANDINGEVTQTRFPTPPSGALAGSDVWL
jgi:transposase